MSMSNTDKAVKHIRRKTRRKGEEVEKMDLLRSFEPNSVPFIYTYYNRA